MKMVGSCYGRFRFLEDSVLNKLFTAGMTRGKMPVPQNYAFIRSTKTGMETRKTINPIKTIGIVTAPKISPAVKCSDPPNNNQSRDNSNSGLAGLNQFNNAPG